MRDVELLLMIIEVVVRLGAEHTLDDSGKMLLLLIEHTETVYHLARGEKIVLVVLVFDFVRIDAHIRTYRAAVVVVAAYGVYQHLRLRVAGANDAPLYELGIRDLGDKRVPVHLAVVYLLGEIHVQRHFIHTAGDHILVAFVEVLLAGDKVAVPEGYGAALVPVLVCVQKLCNDAFPVIIFRGIGQGSRRRGRRQRRHQAEGGQHRGKSSLQFYSFHDLRSFCFIIDILPAGGAVRPAACLQPSPVANIRIAAHGSGDMEQRGGFNAYNLHTAQNDMSEHARNPGICIADA